MSNNKTTDTPSLFSDAEMDALDVHRDEGPVVCLGREFENDEARRAYFRDELRRRLPELRQIEGFPIGTDDDIIRLSDPPYYTACPNPWLNDFIREWEDEKAELEREGKRDKRFRVSEPYASDISVGKNDPIYSAHSYHTKVPHQAIMKLLYYYTQPGDIVYDGFAGTGMTGIAAGMCKYGSLHTNPTEKQKGKRYCICSDLSPIASFISFNLNNNNYSDLNDFSRILNQLEDEYGYMYKTRHTNGKYGDIFFMVWSDVVVCENCGGESLFLDLYSRIGEGRIDNDAVCPHCGGNIHRSTCKKKKEFYYDSLLNKTCERTKSVPYLIVYYYDGHKFRKKPDQEDIKLIDKIKKTPNNSWIPVCQLGDGDKTEDPKAKGVFYIHQLYTDRTLFILSKLWERSTTFNKFYITNSIARNLTKLNRFIVNKYHMNGRINGPLSGTLYVPSEIVEQNIFDLLKVKQTTEVEHINFQNAIQVGDALHNVLLQDASVDYIFTDPPFGDNIMYSELNKISEAWLNVITNNRDEAISNKTQGKKVSDYMHLMQQAFADYFRILKPGKWMTVEFSNTKASIWNAIQSAIQNAGFVVASVSAFDKVHGGIKSMRYSTSVKEDLIITCYKPDDIIIKKITSGRDQSVWEFIEDHLKHLPIHLKKGNATTTVLERDPKILYDRMLSYFVANGISIPIDAKDFQNGLRQRFIERDGMFFTASQALQYEEQRAKTTEFVSLALIVSSEAEGIAWLNRELGNKPQTYQELQPEWMKAMVTPKKGDRLPELMEILEENFIKDDDDRWRKPDAERAADLEIMRQKKMAHEFAIYAEQASKLKAKRMKDCRLEVLRYGFKDCYKRKDYATIISVGDHIQESLLLEDEFLLQYYDNAAERSGME